MINAWHAWHCFGIFIRLFIANWNSSIRSQAKTKATKDSICGQVTVFNALISSSCGAGTPQNGQPGDQKKLCVDGKKAGIDAFHKPSQDFSGTSVPRSSWSKRNYNKSCAGHTKIQPCSHGSSPPGQGRPRSRSRCGKWGSSSPGKQATTGPLVWQKVDVARWKGHQSFHR